MVKDFLYAEKKIYDPVFGNILFDEFEKDVIDSLPFQRLHYIHQMGIAYLVYPGATHTCFEHSLGVTALATLMFDRICKSIRPDVFHFVPRKGSSDYLYWRRVLRMASLCHGLGNLPFSHAAEEDLLSPLERDQWTLKIIDSHYLKPVWDHLRKSPHYLEDVIERDILEDIKKIAVGEKKWKLLTGKSVTPWERIISEIITGDFFGAEKIDLLLRDAKSTGVNYALFDYHQLIEMLRILPSVDKGTDELQIGIDANGLEACEGLLLARHFMEKRIYQCSSVQAYTFHLRRFMKANYSKSSLENVETFLSLSDIDVISALNKAAKDPKMLGHKDAKCVIFRQHRFRAIPLPETLREEELKEFKAKHRLSDTDIEWEFPKVEEGERLAFPVSQRHVVIQKASDSSDILKAIPSKKTNWVFISPEHALELINFLEG